MVYEWIKKLYSVQLYSFHKCLGSWQPKYMKGVFSKQSLSWMSCSLKIFHLLKWPAIALSVQIQYSILRAHKLIYNSREFWIPSNDYIFRLILTTENQNVFHCLIIISSNFLMISPSLSVRLMLWGTLCKFLSSLCSFRNTEDPLCSSTITPKFKTVIDENIYYTQVNYDLIKCKHSFSLWMRDRVTHDNMWGPRIWCLSLHAQGCVDVVFRLASEHYIYFIIVAASLLLIGEYPSLGPL